LANMVSSRMLNRLLPWREWHCLALTVKSSVEVTAD
jgi:hypothetical protein